MLRTLVLSIAERGSVRRIVTGGIGRRVALRFVAGETLEQAIDVTRALNAEGFEASLDHLGENVADPERSRAAAATYRASLDRIASEGLRANISVKLTQLGLDLDPALAYENVESVVRRAAEIGTTVTLDMEDHRYTDRTIDTCLRLQGAHPGRIGVAIQAYLRRTPADLRRLVDARVQVRLCKGAYRERREIAYRSRRTIDGAFARLGATLFASEAYPMIATHDERLIRGALATARRLGRDERSFEIQMLYGVRRELQRRLVAGGNRVRIYVPFGSQWYPYLMRRIAERPANIRFFLEALLRS